MFSLILSTVFAWIIPIFIGERYHEITQYVYLISIAYAFQGMYLMVVNFIFYTKKTHLVSTVTISTSLLHVVLSYNLIYQYGAVGAAYASVISFFITFLFAWIMSNKAFSMPWLTFKELQ